MLIVLCFGIEIKNIIQSYGGKVLFTKNNHINGTSRVSEAVDLVECSHVILIQGDEPLIDINDIRNLNNQMIRFHSKLGTLASFLKKIILNACFIISPTLNCLCVAGFPNLLMTIFVSLWFLICKPQ